MRNSERKEGRFESQYCSPYFLGYRFQPLGIPLGITIADFFGSSGRRDEMLNVSHIRTERALWKNVEWRVLERDPAWRIILLVALDE